MKLGLAATLILASVLTVPAIAIAQNTVRNAQLNNNDSINQNAQTAQTTIGNLQRTNSVALSGEVVRVQGDDFILNDGTGQILVEAESRPLRQASLNAGDRVTVAGTYSDDNSFEAYSITPAGGELIYVFDD